MLAVVLSVLSVGVQVGSFCKFNFLVPIFGQPFSLEKTHQYGKTHQFGKSHQT